MKSLIAVLILMNSMCKGQIGTLVDLRDGRTYKTVVFGSQVWMAENLAFMDNSTEAVCYAGESGLCNKYGALYTWETALLSCPSGWHLPSKVEYDTLFRTIGGNKRDIYQALISGGSSGFDALFGGFVNDYGFRGYHSDGIEQFAYFWSASAKDHMAEAQGLLFSRFKRVMFGRAKKRWGMSVRCVKN